MPETHITAHSGIRCDRLCPFIAKLATYSAIINQSHQYVTEPKGLAALGEAGSELSGNRSSTSDIICLETASQMSHNVKKMGFYCIFR